MNYKALIIGVLIGGMAIVGISIYIGVADRDVEVEDNAYEAGLAFDAVSKRATELGWRVNLSRTLRTGSVVLPIAVFDRNGATINDAAVEVELSRTGGHESRKYRCTGGNDGRYLADVSLDAPGYWDAWVRVKRQQDSLRFIEKIYVQ